MSPASPNAAIQPMIEVHTALAQAVDLQRQGRLDEAAGLYRQVLADSPDDFEATQLLGVVALQQGDFRAAQRLLRSALQMNPGDTAVMANLGTSHMRVGDYEVALQLFTSALDLEPDSAMWQANLGTLLHNMGRHRDAVAPLRKAHRSDPTSYAICMLLGASLVGVGETAEAVAFFDAATRSDPDNSQGWEQLALACNALGQHPEAADHARTALTLDPRSSTALGALGNALFEQGSFTEAVESYAQAVSCGSPSAELFAAFGSALVSNAQHDQAIEQFARAVALDSSRLTVHWAMTMAHLKPVYSSAADAEASRSAFAQSLADVETCYRRGEGFREPFSAVGILQPFYLAYQPQQNRDLLRRYGTLCVDWMSSLPAIRDTAGARSGASHRPRTGSKFRIGVVSSHIHQHSVWTAITRGWVYNIDPERFEIHLFKLDAWSDPETDRAKGIAADFDDQPKDLAGWIESIRDHDLDVIIYPEIGMHTLTLQLASLRLAPVQAAAWGHPETTGLPTMDLYLSAAAFEPPHGSENYVEELVRLPNLGVYVEPLAPSVANPGLASLKLSSGDPLLLCPGTPFKYSPLYDAVWVGIAAQLRKKTFRWRGGARLVFFRSRSAVMDRLFEHRLRSAFDAAGVDFDTQVSIVPALERSRFFGLMRHSALMLDTVGFSGFNTALQAIECALPVLAFEGQFMRGRLASAIMRRLDMPELVAATTESYIEKALALAADAGLRKKLSAKIIERRDALFRDLAPVRALEQRLTEAIAKARAH
jgi:protein O-GlcNAc transferase